MVASDLLIRHSGTWSLEGVLAGPLYWESMNLGAVGMCTNGISSCWSGWGYPEEHFLNVTWHTNALGILTNCVFRVTGLGQGLREAHRSCQDHPWYQGIIYIYDQTHRWVRKSSEWLVISI